VNSHPGDELVNRQNRFYLNFSIQRRFRRLDERRRQNTFFVVTVNVDVEEVFDVADEGNVDLVSTL
jgi:hypothetical protein